MFVSSRIRGGLGLPLVALCAACAGVPDGPPLRLPDAVARVPLPADAALARWWEAYRDPLLTRLIVEAVSADARRVSVCPVAGDDAVAAQERLIAGYDGAAAAARRAEEVALAYFAARRWQEALAVDAAALAQLGDNGTIAEFRRQAGLVSAVDGGLAGTQRDLTETSARARRDAFARSVADLAELTGADAATLTAQLEQASQPPVPGDVVSMADGADGARRADLRALEQRATLRLRQLGVRQADLDDPAAASAKKADEIAHMRDRIAQARAQAAQDIAAARLRVRESAAREAEVHGIEERAAQNAEDARLGYANGALDFAMVYVAQAALASARHAAVAARADRRAALARLWSAAGGGWAPVPENGLSDCE